MGTKIVSVRPENASKGMATTPATIMLHNASTGMLQALMDATALTAIRTAGGSGAATKVLASPSSRTLVVFGAGLQARWHIEAMLEARPSISDIYIINRTLKRATELGASLTKKYSGVTVRIIESKRQSDVSAAVKKADIICTTTNSSQSLFDHTWVRSHTFSLYRHMVK